MLRDQQLMREPAPRRDAASSEEMHVISHYLTWVLETLSTANFALQDLQPSGDVAAALRAIRLAERTLQSELYSPADA